MNAATRDGCRGGGALRRAVAGLCFALAAPAATAQDAPALPLLERAGEAVAEGRYVDALAAYAEALVAAPDEAGVYAGRADLFVSLGHADLAARDYRTAARLSPDDAGLQNNLCRTLALANHDLDGALKACDAAVRLAPRDPVVLATRGYLQLRRGAYERAEADYAAALDLAPASPDEMYGHGVARVQLGRVRDGRDEISSATLDSPGLVLEWESRGFGSQGDIKPGKPVTKASQPIARVSDARVFLNRGEVVVRVADGCGRVVADGARDERAGLSWSGACRFGLAHGAAGAGETGVRFAYGREITDAAVEQKLDLAYQAAEEALLP
jgi:tetratricopeptide (TPR) repeat protein